MGLILVPSSHIRCTVTASPHILQTPVILPLLVNGWPSSNVESGRTAAEAATPPIMSERNLRRSMPNILQPIF